MLISLVEGSQGGGGRFTELDIETMHPGAVGGVLMIAVDRVCFALIKKGVKKVHNDKTAVS